MTPVPWPVGVVHDPTPIPPPPDLPDCPPSADPGAWAAALVWLPAEDAVLHRLAMHGGDLTAHRKIHLET